MLISHVVAVVFSQVVVVNQLKIQLRQAIYGIRLTPKIRGTPDFRGRGPRNQGYLFTKMLKLINVKCQKILKYHSQCQYILHVRQSTSVSPLVN